MKKIITNPMSKISKFLITLIFLSLNFVTPNQIAMANTKLSKSNVEVFKTPSCGCCYGYVLFLKDEEYKVKETDMRSLVNIKKKYNIPLEMQSCHTTIIGKYFVEGHVPIEAVNKLLKEQPDIDGIALPGMPIGTPGMPGDKESPFIVYQLKDGKYSVFMKL